MGLSGGAPARWETQVLMDPLASQQALRLSDRSYTICEMRRMAYICDFSNLFSFFNSKNFVQKKSCPRA